VEMDSNVYSVPWRLIGKTVRATLMGGECARPPPGLQRYRPLACAIMLCVGPSTHPRGRSRARRRGWVGFRRADGDRVN
jgi:hypothetical protein